MEKIIAKIIVVLAFGIMDFHYLILVRREYNRPGIVILASMLGSFCLISIILLTVQT